MHIYIYTFFFARRIHKPVGESPERAAGRDGAGKDKRKKRRERKAGRGRQQKPERNQQPKTGKRSHTRNVQTLEGGRPSQRRHGKYVVSSGAMSKRKQAATGNLERRGRNSRGSILEPGRTRRSQPRHVPSRAAERREEKSLARGA